MLEFISYAFNKLVEVTGLGDFSLEDIYLFIGAVQIVLLVELITVKWEKSALRKIIRFDKSTRTDLIFWLTEVFNVFNLIAFILTLGVAYYLSGLIQNSLDLKLGSYVTNPPLQFFIIYVISDLNAYFSHWLFHVIRPLWKLHEWHHSATDFTVLTRYRGHFVEMSLKRFIDVIPFVLLGASIQTYFAFKLFKELHGLLVHSNIRSSWGFVGKFILVSPAAHRVHHSIKPEHYGKNFGNTLIIWDRIFNTYCESDDTDVLGVPDNPYNSKGFLADTFIGMGRFFKGIFSSK